MKVSGKSIHFVVILGLIAVMLTGCGGGGGGGGTTITPVANAGPDQNVLVGSTVTLDGSGSSGPISSGTWTFISKPAGSTAILSSVTAVKPTFAADKAGSYTLSLVVSNGTVNSSPDAVLIKAVNTRAIPDTGQTALFLAGDDSVYTSNTPSYTDNLDQTITDNVTGLMWQKCPVSLSGASCTTGPLSTYNWYQASGTTNVSSNPTGTSICMTQTTGTHSDWRLPTDFELMAIANYGSSSTAINATYFPNAQSLLYWSSAGSVINSTEAWSVEFVDGTVLTGPKASVNPWGMVRCVRGEESAPVFTDNGDGTITDKATGLMWQKQDNGNTYNWSSALAYCEGLTFATYSNWRVPNIKELRSIADTAKYGPSINSAYFPSTKTDYYWSSTTVASITSLAWTVSFNSGSVNNTVNKTLGSYVRCVR
jgi:hypothetical protein